LQAAFRLLKQTANVAYPQQHFGSLPLEEFLIFLQKNCSKTVFDETTFTNLEVQLVKVLYAEQKIAGNAFTDHFLADTKTWIRYHRKVAEGIPPC